MATPFSWYEITYEHHRGPLKHYMEGELKTKPSQSWRALRRVWDAKTQEWKIWGRLEINIHIAESKEGNPVVNTGLSKLMENEGVHTSAEIIECSSLGTKMSPMTSSWGTLHCLFLSQGIVTISSQSTLGEGFPGAEKHGGRKLRRKQWARGSEADQQSSSTLF